MTDQYCFARIDNFGFDISLGDGLDTQARLSPEFHGTTSFVAFNRSTLRIAAALSCYESTGWRYEPDALILVTIWTSRRHRRQGLATTLAQNMIDAFKPTVIRAYVASDRGNTFVQSIGRKHPGIKIDARCSMGRTPRNLKRSRKKAAPG